MRTWPARFRHVGDVRGLGLMLGVEFVRDQGGKERYPELRNRLVDALFHKGLLVLGAGQNSIRLSPPLVLTEAQADFALDAIEETLGELH